MKSLEFEIYSKEITIWMCGLISADGNISKKSGTSDYICISTSVEKDWIFHISKILSEYGIENSKYPSQTTKANFTDKNYFWRVTLCKRKPKGKHSGINQFISLYESIKKWNIEDFIMGRKFRKLEEIVLRERST